MPKVSKYVGGTNDTGTGIWMTVPVFFDVFPSEDGSLKRKLRVWFQIPNSFQSNLPVPSDDSIKMDERESITIYSVQFGGSAKEAAILSYSSNCPAAHCPGGHSHLPD